MGDGSEQLASAVPFELAFRDWVTWPRCIPGNSTAFHQRQVSAAHITFRIRRKDISYGKKSLVFVITMINVEFHSRTKICDSSKCVRS
jgi:hypothetical protein